MKNKIKNLISNIDFILENLLQAFGATYSDKEIKVMKITIGFVLIFVICFFWVKVL